MKPSEKPLIGISSCLLGEKVRYNKGNKKDSWITSELSKFVDFYPVCPEIEMGLGVPREEIRLKYCEEKETRGLETVRSKIDLTDKALETYERLNNEIRSNDLHGFILMRKSPSCSLLKTKAVNITDKGPGKYIEGLFAYNLVNEFEDLPKIDSGRLLNKQLREKFIKIVYANFRFSKVGKTTRELQEFHKKYKYIYMEHSPKNLTLLGSIAANSNKSNIEEAMDSYRELMLETLSLETSILKRFNVLLHLYGYLKNYLSSIEKKRVLSLLDDFKVGISQYMVSVEILNLLIHKYSVVYLQDHYYFNPYPKHINISRDI
jgi:uncharacterized protein YbgA (DUF1722 family)/uncharacterized protein YbbK (DUF523 family)